MRRIALALAATVAAFGSSALAAPVDDVLKFCKEDFGLPKSVAAADRVTPTGKPRGSMPGADAYREAVKAAAAGMDETALGWLQVCTSHDLMMTLTIINERAAVLAKLKS